MADELEGVRALITGGGGGIGSEMAKGLARAGAKIIVADLDLAAAERIADEIGGWAGAIAIDVRDRSSVKAAVAHTVSRFGGIDAMFNNAGIAQVRQFLDITEDDFRTVMDVNALGVLIGIQEAVRQMQRQSGGGSIVNTASIAGKQGYEPLAHYSASKFAVVGMTQAAARAFGKDKIRVNAICPGVVDTAMWRLIDKGFRDNGLSKNEDEAFNEFASAAVLGRASRPDDLAGVACFLASKGSAFMTGQTLLVDGGMVFD